MKQILLLIICTAFALLAKAQNETGKPFIQNYTPKGYAAETQNWTIVQDNRGVLYFGNNSGVLQYDGSTWRLIPVSNNLIVRALAIDQQGIIYVGSFNELGYLATDTKFISNK